MVFASAIIQKKNYLPTVKILSRITANQHILKDGLDKENVRYQGMIWAQSPGNHDIFGVKIGMNRLYLQFQFNVCLQWSI